MRRADLLSSSVLLVALAVSALAAAPANAYTLTLTPPSSVVFRGGSCPITAHIAPPAPCGGGYPQHDIQFTVTGPGTLSDSVKRTSNTTGDAVVTFTASATETGEATISAHDLTDPQVQDPPPVHVYVFNIVQERRIWWFDGVSPTNQPNLYYLDTTMTAVGATTGTFSWEITSGFVDAGFVDGSSIVSSRTLTDCNTVTLKAKDESATPYTVHIQFSYNGVAAPNTWNTTVRTAKSLASTGADFRTTDATYAYVTYIYYKVVDNVNDDFPGNNIGINEEWTTGVVPDSANMDWRRSNATGAALNPLNWNDEIQGESAGHTPIPIGPADQGAGTPVYHWGQRWRVGSATSAVGVQVQTNTLQKYRGYADHLGIGP